jgi:hypothetical protein
VKRKQRIETETTFQEETEATFQFQEETETTIRKQNTRKEIKI